MKIRLTLDWLLFLAGFLYLAFTALSGPVRYYLNQYNLSVLIYAPQVLLIFFLLVYPLVSMRINRLVAATLGILGVYTIVSLINLRNPLQTFFGLYVLLPFLFALVAYKPFLDYAARSKRLFVMLFLVVCSGVLINLFVSFPWSGFEYSIGEVTIEGSRYWSTQGISRLAGFSRASFSAAAEALLLSLLLVLLTPRKISATLYWIFAGSVIVLTTTKALIATYGLLTLFFIFRSVIRHRLWKALPATMLAVDIAIPLSALFFSISLNIQDRLARLLFASFGERLGDLWPSIFDLVTNHGSWIVGRGVGGIGVAQLYFEPNLYRPGDNLFIYLYATIGVAALVVLFLFVKASRHLEIQRNRQDLFFFTVVIAILGFGLTANVLEAPYFAFFGGLCVAHLYKLGKHNRIIRLAPRNAG